MVMIVERLAEAKVGDHVWHFSAERARYIGTEYKGRGVWTPRQITEENKASFIVNGAKYDRIDGAQRKQGQWVSRDCIAGVYERELFRWKEARYELVRAVGMAPASKLKQIAAIIGFELPGED